MLLFKKMYIWDILENLMNIFLGMEGWEWGGGIGIMSKIKLKRIDILKYYECVVKKIVYEVVG